MTDTAVVDVQAQQPTELILRLNTAQAQALGLASPPKAGAHWECSVEAVVVRSESLTYALTVELRLTSITLEDASPAIDSGAAGKLYKGRRRTAKWRAAKLDERDVGGSPEKGEFGAFNRRFGM